MISCGFPMVFLWVLQVPQPMARRLRQCPRHPRSYENETHQRDQATATTVSGPAIEHNTYPSANRAQKINQM